MSEKTFRIILALVVIIWVIFVLVPSLADSLPRAWARIQYFLPGDNPRVLVVVTDPSEREGVADVRVQIITQQTAFVAITDKNGQAVFESVPAGRALKIRAQKLDYEIGAITDPAIPYRQRARFELTMDRNAGQRIYIAHETASATLGFSLLDAASQMVMTPPGASSDWENMPAGDVRVSAASQRIFILAPNRLVVLSTIDGAKVRDDLPMQATPGGLAVDPNGEAVYTLIAGAGGRSRMLTAFLTRMWIQRFSVQVTTAASSVSLLVSNDGQRLFLSPVGEQYVYVYDARIGMRQAVYAIGDSIKDAALSRDDRTLYVLTERSQAPVTIDVTGNGRPLPVLDQAPENALAGATSIVYAEYQSRRWLCLLQPTAKQVAIIDLNNRTLHTVAVGAEPTSLAHLSSSDHLYVTSKSGNSLTVVSLSNHEVLDTIDVRSRPTLLISPQ